LSDLADKVPAAIGRDSCHATETIALGDRDDAAQYDEHSRAVLARGD
jgi:hypothetical protein